MGRILSFIVNCATMRHDFATEYSATNAWNLNLSNGNANGNGKATNSYRVRPVSALAHLTTTPKDK